MSDSLIIEIVVGEDFAGYIAWMDKDGNYITNDDASSVWLEARDDSDTLVVRFENGADTLTSASASMLGTSGIIRISAPRAITSALPVGKFKYDLVVEFDDPDELVFANGQRTRVSHGHIVTTPMITEP
jgi:hypothetical protein